MQQRVLTILWPAFLVAGLAEACFFTLFDPVEALMLVHSAAWSPTAIYTLGFFFFWGMCALAATLTCYLIKVPDSHQPPF